MSSMDLEKLKMTGAGRAIGVLTSGGDAQGHYKVNHIAPRSLETQEVMLFVFFFPPLRLRLDGLIKRLFFNDVLNTA